MKVMIKKTTKFVYQFIIYKFKSMILHIIYIVMVILLLFSVIFLTSS